MFLTVDDMRPSAMIIDADLLVFIAIRIWKNTHQQIACRLTHNMNVVRVFSTQEDTAEENDIHTYRVVLGPVPAGRSSQTHNTLLLRNKGFYPFLASKLLRNTKGAAQHESLLI